jgi:hypothetical protein
VAEALATGGWLDYKSGWLLDTFSMGAVGYLSEPLYAPSDRDGPCCLLLGRRAMPCSDRGGSPSATRSTPS